MVLVIIDAVSKEITQAKNRHNVLIKNVMQVIIKNMMGFHASTSWIFRSNLSLSKAWPPKS